MGNEWCKAPLPLPSFKVEGLKPEYAGVLHDGLVGELTAITEYLYYHFTTMFTSPELSRMFFCLATVEMEHLDWIARFIVLLGGDPRYTSQEGRYWNATYPRYTKNLCEQITNSLAGERGGMTQYQSQIALIHDPNVQSMLARIIEDEKVHIRILEEKRELYCGPR